MINSFPKDGSPGAEVDMGWILLGVVVVLILWLALSYNGLVSVRQRCNQAFSDIDVQLKQRHDLVPNLVATVQGYAAHERGTLDEVTRARGAAMAAKGPAEQATAESALSGALGRLMAVAEAYPDLKANQNFLQLQAELSDLENKIAAARRFFNNSAAEYNATRQSLPAALFANSMGFAPLEFFSLDAGEKQAVEEPPTVKF
jgi:LemA protein